MTLTEQNVAIFGKGKTGSKVIEVIKQKYGFTPVIFDSKNLPSDNNLNNVKYIIAFVPSDILNDYIDLFIVNDITLVSGATGKKWDDKTEQKIKNRKLQWITGSNFSLGMRVIFEMIKLLEKAKSIWPSVDINIHEVHHTKKIDGPSGTALSWAEWIKLYDTNKITFTREGDVVGDHKLEFKTNSEKIILQHKALDRRLFAEGAVYALEYLINNKLEFGLHYFEDITKQQLR